MIENILLYVLAIWERVKECYFKLFPWAAAIIGVLYGYGLIGASERGHISVSDIPSIMMSIAFFTVAVMFYIIVLLKREINRRDGR